MPNLKEVRIRIASVQSTQQITSAMKMVSASKLRRAQNAILTLRPYARKLQEILGNLSGSIENSSAAVFAEKRRTDKVLLIVITSNKGLCGAFNANIIKTTVRLIQEKYTENQKNGTLELICIGKKGSEFFSRRNYKVLERLDHIFDHLSFEQISPLAERLISDFAQKRYDHIEVIYNQFKNAASQYVTTEQYLPVVASEVTVATTSEPDYIFEPGKEEIVGELLPKTLKIQLYKAILDSFAAEHGARMTAMHKATDNAQELLKNLRLSYNKARQAAITNEILEIVSGAEALKSN